VFASTAELTDYRLVSQPQADLDIEAAFSFTIPIASGKFALSSLVQQVLSLLPQPTQVDPILSRSGTRDKTLYVRKQESSKKLPG
jgi:hypothetical protein